MLEHFDSFTMLDYSLDGINRGFDDFVSKIVKADLYLGMVVLHLIVTMFRT